MHTNNRGQTVTSCLGKLFSSILCSRLYNMIEENDLISKPQIAFMKNRRTADNLFVFESYHRGK